ncbi:hypothetical protein [Spirosoma radiotolerans]|nr:hypothetical protein [Spirosoma radiotolerans]
MVLFHEWSHSVIGWLFGYKAHPFAIHYGDWTLIHADENIDYEPIFQSSSPWKASFIAGAALLTNVLLLLASRKGLRQSASRRQPFLTQACFWFAVFNLAELYSYMPLRAFSSGGDVGHVEIGLGMSAWIGFIMGTPLIGWQLVELLTKDLPIIYQAMAIKSIGSKLYYTALTVSIIFGLYGSAPLFYYGLLAPQTRWSLFSAVVWVVVLTLLIRLEMGKHYHKRDTLD